jgi:hypothetical protein
MFATPCVTAPTVYVWVVDVSVIGTVIAADDWPTAVVPANEFTGCIWAAPTQGAKAPPHASDNITTNRNGRDDRK